MRYNDIRKQYTKHGGLWTDENKLLLVGEQMQYEWEQDFNTMLWALKRIDEFLKVAKENNYFTGTLHIAKEELLNRISKYSCPSNLKHEYKTIENCPLKENCKCLQNVSVNGS